VELIVVGCVLLGVVMIGLLVVVVPLSIRAERARKEALWRWATAHGWTFVESSRPPWASRLPSGHHGRVGVTLTGMLGGRWVTVADYSYQTTSTVADSTTTTIHRFIVVLVQLDRPHPPVAVVGRGLVSQLGRALFGDRPTATGNVMFDSQFRITAADPKYAGWLVGPPLFAALIAGAVPQWSVVGTELLTYKATSHRLSDPSSIPWLAAPLLHVADLLGR
jgi:hypothetical protein